MTKRDGKLPGKDEHKGPVRVINTRDGKEVKTDFKDIYCDGDTVIVYDANKREHVRIPVDNARIEKERQD